MLLFTNSFRGDLEAFLIGQNFVSGWSGNTGDLIGQTWKVTGEEFESHQAKLWGILAEISAFRGARFSPLAPVGVGAHTHRANFVSESHPVLQTL